MDKNLENQLKNVQINPAKAFKNGQNTSIIQDTIKSGASIVGASAFTTGLTKQITPELIQEISKEVISYATQKVVEECTKLVADYTKIHLQMSESIASRLVQRTQDVFNDNKITFQEALSEISGEDDEDLLEKRKEEEEEKSKNEFIEKFKGRLTTINQIIAEYSGEVSNKLEDINKFIQAGPECLNSEINKQIKYIHKDVKGKIDENIKKEQEAIDNFINNQAQISGEALAEKFNNEIRERAREYKYGQDKAKAKVEQKKQVATQKQKIKLMAKTGLK